MQPIKYSNFNRKYFYVPPKQEPPCVLQPVLTGEELASIVAPLSGRRREQWCEEEIQTVVKQLAGRRGYDMSNISPTDLAIYDAWTMEWTALKASRPDIVKALDPFYVIFAFAGNGACAAAPAGWAASILACNVALAPVALFGTDYIYSLPNELAARHFGGFMAGRHPGVGFVVADSTAFTFWS
jgi:hypothetical protein